MRALVTGANGFLGHHVTNADLVPLGHPAVADLRALPVRDASLAGVVFEKMQEVGVDSKGRPQLKATRLIASVALRTKMISRSLGAPMKRARSRRAPSKRAVASSLSS